MAVEGTALSRYVRARVAGSVLNFDEAKPASNAVKRGIGPDAQVRIAGRGMFYPIRDLIQETGVQRREGPVAIQRLHPEPCPGSRATQGAAREKPKRRRPSRHPGEIPDQRTAKLLVRFLAGVEMFRDLFHFRFHARRGQKQRLPDLRTDYRRPQPVPEQGPIRFDGDVQRRGGKPCAKAAGVDSPSPTESIHQLAAAAS